MADLLRSPDGLVHVVLYDGKDGRWRYTLRCTSLYLENDLTGVLGPATCLECLYSELRQCVGCLHMCNLSEACIYCLGGDWSQNGELCPNCLEDRRF